jgi:N-acyl-D-aspartate/D-glutamate deacylase
MKGCCRLALLVYLIALGPGIIGTVHSGHTATLQPYDLVITNARIVDDSGNPWFRADVGIKDGRIARIGRVAASQAAQTIDAREQILAPGFVDVHTHVESTCCLV